MNSLKRKVISTSIIVIFALLSVIGSTFAWFTIDSFATVGPVDLTIGTDVSLLVMMDEGYVYDYDDSLSVDDNTLLNNPANDKYVNDLTTAIITPIYNYLTIKLEPVTTTDGLTFNRSRQHSSAVASFTPGTGQYIQFSIWILSQESNATVAVRNFQSSASNAIGFKNQVKEAVRLSIQTHREPNVISIFGINKDYDFTYRSDQIGYDSGTSANNIIPAAQKAFLESKHAEYYTTLDGETTTIENERNILLPQADTVVTLTANQPEKVTIRIWIEGWDTHANNNVMSALFQVKFDFVIKATS